MEHNAEIAPFSLPTGASGAPPPPPTQSRSASVIAVAELAWCTAQGKVGENRGLVGSGVV